eukprot:303672-Hanusia_phi.AAC.1
MTQSHSANLDFSTTSCAVPDTTDCNDGSTFRGLDEDSQCIDLGALKTGDIFYDYFWHERFCLFAAERDTCRGSDLDANGGAPSGSIHSSPAVAAWQAPTKECEPGSKTEGNGCRKPAKSNHWTEDEHERFLRGLELFGASKSVSFNDDGTLFVGLGAGVAEKISKIVGTRSPCQVRTHAQKYFLKMTRNMKRDARRLPR